MSFNDMIGKIRKNNNSLKKDDDLFGIFGDAITSVAGDTDFRRVLNDAEANLIRSWYTSAYPDDNLGYELDMRVSFDDVWNLLQGGQGRRFYDLIGIGDSVVRERIFTRLAEIRNVSYDTIYDMWLGN